MTFRKVYTALALAGVLLAAPGCKDFFDVNTDPLNATRAELTQLLPGTQVAMATYLGFNIQGLGQPASALMGQLTNTRGVGLYNQDPNAFQTPWSGLYTDMLENNEIIIRQATTEQNWAYVGVAQLQKAYVFSQLVDGFGDVAYSEALRGTEGLRNPRFDAAESIYNGATGIQSLFSLIDEGIANLEKPGVLLTAGATSDIIYGGNLDQWRRFGRSLKLKLYNQIRKTRDVSAEVQALLGQDLLSGNGDNFEVRYGIANSPENRHIGFLSDYVNTPSENAIGPYLYLLMRNGRGTNYQPDTRRSITQADPRIPYYFFNQLTTDAPTAVIATLDFRDSTFVSTRNGSTSVQAGTNNADLRSLPGLYPYGGRYDNGLGGATDESSSPGNGTQRLLPYFNQKFTEAEIQLMVLNNPTAANTAYMAGVTAAFDEVNRVAARVNGAGASSPAPTLVAPPANIMQLFTNASTTEDKLRVLMEQKYIASFGMGLDIFTDFRRTHYPILSIPTLDNSDALLQVGLVADSTGSQEDNITRSTGAFPRRFYYPQNDLFANLSPEAPKGQVLPGTPNYRIFWDK